MNKQRFKELSDAIRQAKAVRRGDAAPTRVWKVFLNKKGQLLRRQIEPEVYQKERRACPKNIGV